MTVPHPHHILKTGESLIGGIPDQEHPGCRRRQLGLRLNRQCRKEFPKRNAVNIRCLTNGLVVCDRTTEATHTKAKENFR